MSNEDDDIPAVTAPDAGDVPGTPIAERVDTGEVAQGHGFRRRTYSDQTRALFSKAAEAVKKGLGDGETDDLEPAIAPPAPDKQPAAVAGAADSTAKVAESTLSTTPPPTAALDPAVVSQHERMNLRAAQLAEREAKLLEREKAAGAGNLAERFADDPIGTLRELAKANGHEKDDDFRSFAADLITELSGQVLSLPLPDQAKARAELRKAERLVKKHQAELKKRDLDEQQRTASAEQQRQVQAAQNLIKKDLEAEAARAKFPYLSLEDDPHLLVWDVIEEQYKRDGSLLEPDVAAQKVETYLKTKASAWTAKRKHLLFPEAIPQGQQPQQPTSSSTAAPQGDPQSHRRSRAPQTLTNAAAAAAPTPPADSGRTWSNEDHRRSSLAKLRENLRDE